MEYLADQEFIAQDLKHALFLKAWETAVASPQFPADSLPGLPIAQRDLHIMVPIMYRAAKFGAAQPGAPLQAAVTSGISDVVAGFTGMLSNQIQSGMERLASMGPGLHGEALRAAKSRFAGVDSALFQAELEGLPLTTVEEVLPVVYRAALRPAYDARGVSDVISDADGLLAVLIDSGSLPEALRARVLSNVKIFGPIVLGLAKKTLGRGLLTLLGSGQAAIESLAQNAVDVAQASLTKCCGFLRKKALRSLAALEQFNQDRAAVTAIAERTAFSLSDVLAVNGSRAPSSVALSAAAPSAPAATRKRRVIVRRKRAAKPSADDASAAPVDVV
jgi:hypothetical protein